MKITTKEIKQLIKEEIENVLGEQQLNEGGGMMAALAFLFAGGAENITIDGKSFTQDTLAQTLDTDGDDKLDKEFPQSMLKVMKSDVKAGLVDFDPKNPKLKSTDFRLGNQQMSAVADGVPDAPSKLKSGSKTMKSGNIKMQLVQLQGAINVNGAESDGAKKVAKTILQNSQFKTLDTAQQEMVKKIAGVADLAR